MWPQGFQYLYSVVQSIVKHFTGFLSILEVLSLYDKTFTTLIPDAFGVISNCFYLLFSNSYIFLYKETSKFYFPFNRILKSSFFKYSRVTRSEKADFMKMIARHSISRIAQKIQTVFKSHCLGLSNQNQNFRMSIFCVWK